MERALVGWESFGGTSDIARDFSRFYLGLTPPCGHMGLREASPLDRAADIQTPTLIIHSEDDLRCPIEQAEQLFMTLLRNDVDVEMIRFPAESHELSRSGRRATGSNDSSTFSNGTTPTLVSGDRDSRFSPSVRPLG